jgi:signal peptidase II
VTDFLNVGIGNLRTGIFNIADMAIMTGALLLLWKLRSAPAETSLPR